MKKLSAIAAWFLLRLALLLGRILPPGPARKLGEIVGALFYLISRKRKQVALYNMKVVFPEWSERRRRRELRASLRGWGRTLFEITLIVGKKGKRLVKEVSVEGVDNLRDALARGRGAVAVGGHVGNFPLMLYTLITTGYPVSVIMRLPENELLAPWVKETVENLGIEIIPASPRIESVKQSIRALRAGKIVFLHIDINAKKSSGVLVDFFGLKVPTFPGAVVFAQRSGAPLVPMFIARNDRSGYKLEIREPFEVPRGEDRELVISETLTRLTKILEEVIREHPAEWWWLHRRFRKAVRPNSADPADGSV